VSLNSLQLALPDLTLTAFSFVPLLGFGLSYRLYPPLQRSRLAMPHFLASSIGALLFPLGSYISMRRGVPTVAVAGLAILAGAVLFAPNLVLSVALSTAPGRSAGAMPWAA
jgi:hypothetical protein